MHGQLGVLSEMLECTNQFYIHTIDPLLEQCTKVNQFQTDRSYSMVLKIVCAFAYTMASKWYLDLRKRSTLHYAYIVVC